MPTNVIMPQNINSCSGDETVAGVAKAGTGTSTKMGHTR